MTFSIVSSFEKLLKVILQLSLMNNYNVLQLLEKNMKQKGDFEIVIGCMLTCSKLT